MSEFEYDLVVIGGGSGGVRCSRISASLGAKVAIVELPYHPISSDTAGGFGGTCVLRGCVPKKLFVYGAGFSADFEDAAGFGWEESKPSFDWSHLMRAKSKEIQRLNGVYKRMLGNTGVEIVEGRGTVKDAHTVEVGLASLTGSRVLKTKNIVVATGSRAVRLDIPGSELTITSDEALCLDECPKRIAVIGAGYIAVEFAGIFKGVGSEVHLVYRADTPLRGFDTECREQVAENLEKRGIRMHAGHVPIKIEQNADGSFNLTTDGGSKGQQVLTVDQVMMATGRAPLSGNLGLEETGVKLDSKGAVIVDDYSCTSVPSVYAVGDITNRINLTPVAIMEGHAVANTLFDNKPTKPDHADVASAVFCQPPMASCGFTEEEAIAATAGELDVYVARFKPMKNTLSGREEKALMKLIVEVESGRVVGAHMVGADSPEIMQGIGIAMKCGATKSQFDSTVGIHPSAAEEFVTMRTPTRRVKGTAK